MFQTNVTVTFNLDYPFLHYMPPKKILMNYTDDMAAQFKANNLVNYRTLHRIMIPCICPLTSDLCHCRER